MNEILKSLNVADLNQRYGGSTVWYNKKAIYIENFLNPNLFTFEDSELAGLFKEPFDYRLLDTERPTPRWIEIRDKLFYFCYRAQRQWCRGFNRNSCTIYSPVENQSPFEFSPRWHEVVRTLYTTPMPPKGKYKLSTLIELLKVRPQGIILSPNLAVISYRSSEEEEHTDVFFRTTPIANINKSACTITLTKNDFNQELSEVIY